MRLVIVLCLLAACGGSPATPLSATPRATETRSTPRPPLTKRDMLRALPGDARMLVAFDVAKLRHSSLATRAWAQLAELPFIAKLMDAMCGLTDDVSYAVFAMRDAGL